MAGDDAELTLLRTSEPRSAAAFPQGIISIGSAAVCLGLCLLSLFHFIAPDGTNQRLSLTAGVHLKATSHPWPVTPASPARQLHPNTLSYGVHSRPHTAKAVSRSFEAAVGVPRGAAHAGPAVGMTVVGVGAWVAGAGVLLGSLGLLAGMMARRVAGQLHAVEPNGATIVQKVSEEVPCMCSCMCSWIGMYSNYTPNPQPHSLPTGQPKSL